MDKGAIIDSNVVIDYLDEKLPQDGMEFVSFLVDKKPHISVISKMEILRFNGSADEMDVLNDFVNNSFIHQLEDTTVNNTIKLCHVVPKIKLPDAIIATTALENNFALVTRNIDDFKSITGLHIINPYDDSILTYSEN
jgi:predicted nucleic acid-binding protein